MTQINENEHAADEEAGTRREAPHSSTQGISHAERYFIKHVILAVSNKNAYEPFNIEFDKSPAMTRY